MRDPVLRPVQANEGKDVPAIVLRQGETVTLTLRPERWAGQGLLGCHLRPLQAS